MSRVKTILLVCTGNSCRSVMAGALLKQLLKGKGDYQVLTAGTSAVNGHPASNAAQQVMTEEGIDVSGHQSSYLTQEMINKADLILVMSTTHKNVILSRTPQAQAKVHLLTEFGRDEKENRLVDPDIADPAGADIEVYRQVFAIIKESILRTVEKLEEE